MKSIPDMFTEIRNFFSDLSNAIGQGNIKEFDNIVMNTEGITENQIIY